MRWICKDDIEEVLKQEWLDAASSMLDEVKAATSNEERKRIIKNPRASKIWRDFYNLLPDGLKRKCWYCEAEEIRSDMPVDHFRPKQKVEGRDEHNGYWWLAFDWENYRCACTFCNSRRVFDETDGGKQNFFPVEDEACRACSPNDDWREEQPAILDPFNVDDEKLLWFDGDGKPQPSPQCVELEKIKVSNSICIFHLDEVRLVRKRKQKQLKIDRKIREL